MSDNKFDSNINSSQNQTTSDNPFLGLRDVGQAEDILNRVQREGKEDQTRIEQLLDQLLDALFSSQEPLTGSSNDFHNFTVSISKSSNDNRSAFRIVTEGLKLHSDNTDLLADAILYGRYCGAREDCARWYQKLKAIDQTAWTWRSFSFSIDFLLEEYASKRISAEEILALVKQYQEYKPDEEDAWLSEYDFYNNTNNRAKGVEALEAADKKFTFCPKCWLRYADIMMDDGKFDKAEPFIKKLKKNPKSGESVNMSYVFLLDGLCRMTKMMATDQYEDGEYDEKEIKKIYKSFDIAVSMRGLRESYRQQIIEQIDRLERETDVKYPYPRP